MFVIFVGGGWLFGKLLGGFLFPDREEKPTYIDKSVHYHYYDNRSVHVDGEEFKSLKNGNSNS